MENASTGKFTARRVAAAMFTEPTNLHDAVSDLREAGFGNLAIAFSTEATPTRGDGSKNRRTREKFLNGEKHSFAWRMRHAFESDLQRQGAELVTGSSREFLSKMEAEIIVPRGKSGMPSGAPDRKVDLEKVLRARRVPKFRIDLLRREIGPSGSLLLVETGRRSNEAQEILERNCGINRTQMATERPPKGAAEHEGMLEFQVLRETVL